MNDWGMHTTVFDDMAEAGGVFEGEVDRPAPVEKDQVRGMRVALILRASGEGDPGERSVSGVEIQAAPDGRIASRFQLPVPEEGPISYEGRLLRLQWRIEFTVDIKRRPDETFDYPVLVVPRGGLGIYPGPHPLRR